MRGESIEGGNLRLDDLVYHSGGAEEHFLSWLTQDDRLAGFLRLSLPSANSPYIGVRDLVEAAIIHEVHVYGQSLQVGEAKDGAAQHTGLGTQLLEKADEIARSHGYRRIAVISAIGTRRYYLDRGYSRGELYLVKDL